MIYSSLVFNVLISCKYKDIDHIDTEKMRFLSQDSVTLKLTYMAYACGDCYPQYRVDEVVYSENSEEEFFLIKN